MCWVLLAVMARVGGPRQDCRRASDQSAESLQGTKTVGESSRKEWTSILSERSDMEQLHAEKESWCGWGEPKVGSRELWDDWTARAWENGAFVGITAGQLARPEATGGRRRLRQQKAPSSTSPVPHGRCETANPKERRRAKVCRRGRGLELKVVSHWARMCTRLAVCAGYRTG